MPVWLIDVLKLIAGGAVLAFAVYFVWSIGSDRRQDQAHREGVRGYNEGYKDGYRDGLHSLDEPPGDA